MIRKFLTLLLTLFVGGSTLAWGQTSRSTSIPMTLTLAPSLSCSLDGGIAYGTVNRTQGTVSTSLSNFAQVTCDSDPNATYDITFGLPSQMVNPASNGSGIPLTFGSTSAFVNCNGQVFNPAAGLSNDQCTSGHVVIQLGVPRTGGPSDLVTANLSNASPAGGGAYSATIVLNVTSR
jgi:hypothetical protein